MAHPLPPRERGRAPRAGGPHALSVVFRADEQALGQALREQAALQINAGREMKQPLTETVGLRRSLEDEPDTLLRLVQELLVRHHLRDEPVPEGLGGVQVLAAEQYVPCPRETHELDQAHASAVARDKADHALPEHEAGVLRGDTQVAREGELGPGASCKAPYSRNDRLLEPFDGRDEAGQLVAVGAKLGLLPIALKAGEVTACRERLAAAGQDYSSHLPVARCVRKDLQQLALQRLVEGVLPVGAIQLDEECAVFQHGSQVRTLGHRLMTSNGLLQLRQ